MAKYRGRYLLPPKFVYGSILPAFATRPKVWAMAGAQLRRYLGGNDPDRDQRVSQVSIRCTDLCDLRCRTCGQWGENGWLLAKQRSGAKLDSMSQETALRIVHETKRDRPFRDQNNTF